MLHLLWFVYMDDKKEFATHYKFRYETQINPINSQI